MYRFFVVLIFCLIERNEASLLGILPRPELGGYPGDNYRCSCSNGANQIPFNTNGNKLQMMLDPMSPFNNMLGPNLNPGSNYGLPSLGMQGIPPQPLGQVCSAASMNPFAQSNLGALGQGMQWSGYPNNPQSPLGILGGSLQSGYSMNSPYSNFGTGLGMSSMNPFSSLGGLPTNTYGMGLGGSLGGLSLGVGASLGGATPMMYSGLNVKGSSTPSKGNNNIQTRSALSKNTNNMSNQNPNMQGKPTPGINNNYGNMPQPAAMPSMPGSNVGQGFQLPGAVHGNGGFSMNYSPPQIQGIPQGFPNNGGPPDNMKGGSNNINPGQPQPNPSNQGFMAGNGLNGNPNFDPNLNKNGMPNQNNPFAGR